MFVAYVAIEREWERVMCCVQLSIYLFHCSHWPKRGQVKCEVKRRIRLISKGHAKTQLFGKCVRPKVLRSIQSIAFISADLKSDRKRQRAAMKVVSLSLSLSHL